MPGASWPAAASSPHAATRTSSWRAMSGERRDDPVEREESYGGVALRPGAHGGPVEVVVIRPRGRALLALPKGGADPGESGADAAAREVREETGVTVTVGEPLGDVSY